jgi:uncharacterized protein (DUF983 family)
MTYKTLCPACGSKISRRYIFFEPKWKHRCRSCGILLRSGRGGVVATFVIVGIFLLCFAAYRAHMLSAPLAATLILAIGVGSFVLFPYFMRVEIVTEGRCAGGSKT